MEEMREEIWGNIETESASLPLPRQHIHPPPAVPLHLALYFGAPFCRIARHASSPPKNLRPTVLRGRYGTVLGQVANQVQGLVSLLDKLMAPSGGEDED